MTLKFNPKLVKTISNKEIQNQYKLKISKIHKSIVDKTCLGNEMLGWYDYPNDSCLSLLKNIKNLANQWKKLKINEVVIAGIGGSYTGIKAILQFVCNSRRTKNINFTFFDSLSTNNLTYIKNLKNKNWAIIVISKSGGTLETSINFRILREELKKKYKNKHNERIVAITDPNHGALNKLCKKHNYKMLAIYPNIGGRFSTITPVGLFPAALVNIDIDEIIRGAKQAKNDLKSDDLNKNSAYLYAAYRHYLYKICHYDVENVMVYEENLEYLCIQHRQLFGETEGKNKDSLYPTYSICTTDLHSMGQLLQEGKQIFFETVIKINKPFQNINIQKSSFENDDQLDYLSNKSLHEINYLVCEAVKKAHSNVGINILEIILDDMSEYTFGYVYFWLSLATTMSGLLLGHNPFNQPGVQAYKNLMFKMLGKK
ncbi:glucose-6-phosphate isomerase [Mycoplasmoides pirum]|uniref:glucose-6-phosphate isomerase n=1 Tax=Mycoplasmoides pirum TaxID=2122 RepID=UPI00056333CA|nr:glucose-6-phosphate isomerase [Mycoplasmoides pirum]